MSNEEKKELTLEELKAELDELKKWKEEMDKFVSEQHTVNQAFSRAIQAFGDFAKAVKKNFSGAENGSEDVSKN